MGKYLDIPFPNVRDAFDGHIHLHRWLDNENGADFLHGFEEYREKCGLKYIALAPLPSGNPVPVPRDVSNNIICAFYKLLNKNTFLYGGLTYPSYPACASEMAEKNMSLIEQYNELMEIGCDGIKMLEGKPNLYKRVGKALDSDFFEPVFDQMEKDGTYILMHVRDPQNFWTEASEERIKKQWYYGDGTYPTFEELYTQIENILKKHPNLNLCLAHFFFCSETPEKLSALLDKYPNLTVDITPGGEMYIEFNKHPEYFYEFFKKYNDRIIFGTDMDFPVFLEAGVWLSDREYRYFATDEVLDSFANCKIKGISLPKEYLQNIFSDNLLKKLGGKPREINKQALRKYIEKYDYLIIDRDLSKKIEELKEQYL